MPRYICVDDENSCSNAESSLEAAFEWLHNETECNLDQCTFYEVNEVQVEMKLVVVPKIVKKGA